jgi:hypothetical protein
LKDKFKDDQKELNNVSLNYEVTKPIGAQAVRAAFQ